MALHLQSWGPTLGHLVTPPSGFFPAHDGCGILVNLTPVLTQHAPTSFQRPSCCFISQKGLSLLGFYKTLTLDQMLVEGLLCFECMQACACVCVFTHVLPVFIELYCQRACKTRGCGPVILCSGCLTVSASHHDVHQSRCSAKTLK